MSECRECGGLLKEFPLGNCTNPHVETPTDKSPQPIWVDGNTIIRHGNGPWCPIGVPYVEHSAYLAVKQELDAARAEIKAIRHEMHMYASNLRKTTLRCICADQRAD